MYFAPQYKCHKRGVQFLIDSTRQERFDLEDTLRVEANLFMNDSTKSDFGLLMVRTTRTKIHRYVVSC